MAQQTAVEWIVNKLNTEFIRELPIYRWSEVFHLVEKAKQMEKDQLKQEFIEGYNLGYEDAKCNHINDGENLAQEREYLKESTCEYSGLRSVQSYEDLKI